MSHHHHHSKKHHQHAEHAEAVENFENSSHEQACGEEGDCGCHGEAVKNYGCKIKKFVQQYKVYLIAGAAILIALNVRRKLHAKSPLEKLARNLPKNLDLKNLDLKNLDLKSLAHEGKKKLDENGLKKIKETLPEPLYNALKEILEKNAGDAGKKGLKLLKKKLPHPLYEEIKEAVSELKD